MDERAGDNRAVFSEGEADFAAGPRGASFLNRRRLWRLLIVFLALAAGLELTGRFLFSAFQVSAGVTGSLSFAAIVLLGGISVYVVARLHSARWVVGAISLGAGSLVLSQVVSLAGYFRVPVLAPILEHFSAVQIVLEEGGFVLGLTLVVGAFYRAIFAADIANERLLRKCQELAEEAEERKSTRTALREKEEQYRHLVETFPHAILIVQDGKIVFANPAAATTLRVPGEENLIGVDPFQFIAPAELERMRGYMKARLQKNGDAPASYEARFRRADGEEYPALQYVRTTIFRGARAIQIVGMDLSEMRRMESALEHERRLLSDIVETNPESLFILDRSLNIIAANETCARRLGLPRDELINTGLLSLLPDGVRQRRHKLLEEAMRTATPVRFEDTRAGLCFDNYVHPLLDSRGEVFGCAVMAVDITRRNELEAALRSINIELEERVLRRTSELSEANERLEAEIREREAAQKRLAETLEFDQKLIAVSPLSIAAYKASGECVLANEALARMLGGRLEEVLRINFRQTSSWTNSEFLAIAEQTLASGRPHSGEQHGLSPFGKELWVDYSLMPFVSGGEQHLLLMASDIAERKAMETALKDSESKYRELVQNANSIILRMDVNGVITFINEFAQQFFGYSEAEILGQNVVGTIVPVTDSEGKDLSEMIHALLTHPKQFMNNENENVRRDGERVWIAWTNTPIFGSDGGFKECLCVGNDVTARVHAERIIAKQQAQMLHTARLSALGTMASGIAHEINNPLAVISTGIQQLETLFDHGFPDPVNISRIIQTTLRHVSRVHKIVEGLRNLSRDGSSDPFALIAVGEILTETLELCQERFRVHGIELDWPHVPSDLKIECRSSQISQVLLNLLNNAYDAVESLEEKWVRVELSEDNGYVTLSVTDSGATPAEAARGKLFIPFYSTKTKATGTGLGLSISKSIVESHHGDILLDTGCSNTRFLVRLPRHQPNALPGGGPAEPC